MPAPSPIRASAPGKLVVVGEYAVLRGHPAVVAAVDVRARATRRAGPLRVPDDPGGLLRACTATLEAAGLAPADGAYDIDTAAFHDAGRKLGLGSSSAACVAFLAAAIGDATPARLHPLAHAAHRAFSGGRGSGVDVAAAVHGGVSVFRVGEALPEVRPAPGFPDGVRVLVVWTGRSQDTRDFVGRVLALPDADDALAPIAAAVDGFLAARDAGALLDAVDAAGDAMARLGRRAGADIVSEPHARLRALARRLGGAAKPSGAGGGDVGLLFVPVDREAEAREAVAATGLEVVDLAVGAPGARLEAP